jgi:hypothetical protein
MAPNNRMDLDNVPPGMLFILNERGEPVEERNISRWSDWLATNARTVRIETIGDSTVSTIYLGLDHNFLQGGPPILWETMVFGGKLAHKQTRCAGSREQAEAMHAAMIEKVKAA